MEETIETNKVDYGTYDNALKYVQTQLRKHQEKSTPVPMDIGNIEQNNREQKPEHEQSTMKNKNRNQQHAYHAAALKHNGI